jgi:hypothetical protein
MRFIPYPYQTTQAIGWDKNKMMGDHLDATHFFKWSTVRLNLPGSPDYDPLMQWVAKIRMEDGRVTMDLFIYIDDLRSAAPDGGECRQ